jgi:flagellar biosynthesis/type III secretory pathway protein FliH
LNDGRNDRQSGHSFRPTQDGNYKHADRGYSSGLGDKNQYKQVYRQGYEQGYQQGYNSGGYGRWRY